MHRRHDRVEAIDRTLDMAIARQRPIQAITIPVDDEAQSCQPQVSSVVMVSKKPMKITNAPKILTEVSISGVTQAGCLAANHCKSGRSSGPVKVSRNAFMLADILGFLFSVSSVSFSYGTCGSRHIGHHSGQIGKVTLHCPGAWRINEAACSNTRSALLPAQLAGQNNAGKSISSEAKSW